MHHMLAWMAVSGGRGSVDWPSMNSELRHYQSPSHSLKFQWQRDPHESQMSHFDTPMASHTCHIIVGYTPSVKGYKLYDLEKKKFIVSRNVQFFEENFDHSEEKVKSDDAGQADLKFIYPDMNQVVVVNLYLTRVIPSEYLKVYLLSIGALN